MVLNRRVALCGLLVATLLGTVALTGAAPPPRPLCEACGDSFEETAASRGVSVAVERSTATVSVHGNGSATWVVVNRLGDSEGVARLRADDRLRTDVAERAMRDAELLDVTLSANGVLTARYRERGFAERSVGGALRSGEFTEAYGYRNLRGLGADRLVVVAPDGTRVDWAVPGASVSEDGDRMTLNRFDDRGFVTFVPDDAAVGPVLSLLAVGELVGPAFGTNVLVRIAFPTALFGLFVGGAGSLLASSGRRFERVGEMAGVTLVGLGMLASGLALVAAGGISLFGGAAAPVFGVGVAAIGFGAALSRPAVRDRVTYRRLVLGAGVGVLVAAGSTLGAAVAFDQNGTTRSLFAGFPALVPVLALLPAGYAFGRGNRRLAVATAAVAFALSVLPFVWPMRFLLFVAVFATAYAAVIVVAGTPFLAVGVALAASTAVEEQERPAGR